MTPLDVILSICGSIVAISAAGFAVFKLFRPFFKKVSHLMTTTDHFLKDWAGEPAGPGRDKIPGVMERLNKIDGELSRNGGKSVKDTVNRVEKELSQLRATLTEFAVRLDSVEKTVEKVKR